VAGGSRRGVAKARGDRKRTVLSFTYPMKVQEKHKGAGEIPIKLMK